MPGKMQPFQLGLGIMVKELGIPVVPIKISGTEWKNSEYSPLTFCHRGLLRDQPNDKGEIRC
jgi:1-acyl-sn-glycerol-3-phosphate acyltransferase